MIYYIIFYYVWCLPLSLLGVWRALLPVDVMSCHILVVWCLVVWGSPSLVDVMWRRPNVAWRGVPHYVGVVWSPPIVMWCGVVCGPAPRPPWTWCGALQNLVWRGVSHTVDVVRYSPCDVLAMPSPAYPTRLRPAAYCHCDAEPFILYCDTLY